MRKMSHLTELLQVCEVDEPKAEELGLTGSHFTNPCGLEDPDHVSTARDLAILGREL